MNLTNLRVAPKLWLTILGLLVAMSLSNLWVQNNTTKVLEQSRQDVQHIERKIALAQHMRGNILRTVEVATAQIATNENRLQKEFTQRLEQRLQETMSSMDVMRAALVTDLDRQKFEAMRQAFETTKRLRVESEQHMDLDDYNARANFAFGAYSDSVQIYFKALEEFIEAQNSQLQVLVGQADAAKQRSAYVGWGMSATLLLLGMLLARWLVRNINQPLQDAVQMAEAIGQGDLTVQAKSQRQDELGQLLQALSAMAAHLRSVIGEVRQGVDAVSSAAGQIASGNQDLSARTEQTAANLQQTAASVEQMNASVVQAADTSRQANQLAVTAVQAAERGGDVVQQVVQSMEQINTSSRKISDIIGVIDGIAFQTNILALNAAVEAARAGEQGRGFAVVAGEVRTLAQRSAEAAKEIKGLIEASVSNVEAGSSQVHQAGSSMDEIVSSVRRVTDLIGEITASSSEQSQGFGQVNTAVSSLDQMTQQNAALVEESSAAANAMHEQAQRLLQVVSAFNVGHSTASVAAAPVVAAPTLAPRTQPRAPVKATATAEKPARQEPKLAAAPKPEAPKIARAAPAPAPAASAADDDWETF